MKFIIFAIIGGAGLLISLAVTYALTEYVGLWYFLSYVLATLIAWTAVFFANSLITFAGHSKENYLRRYITFIAGYSVIFLWNAGFVYILTSLLHVYYLISIAAVSLASTVVTFFFSKRHVYHDLGTKEVAD